MFQNVDLNEQNLLKNDSLGQLEHSVHNMFSYSRTSADNYVYSQSPELLNILDNYCVDYQNGYRPPLLVLGEPGIGKSALLSNWIIHRKRKKTYSRHTLEEYIFWHSVGCSELSCKENNLIYRLIQGLKETFNISRDIPIHAQEKLRWELPRFLELAAKKGKIIIIIDGVHRIAPDEKNDSVLSWLPQQSNNNVKIILTATIPIGSSIFQMKTNESALEKAKHLSEAAKVAAEATESAYESKPDTAADREFTIPANYVPYKPISAAKLAELSVSRKAASRILRQLEKRQLQILRLRSLDKLQTGNIVKTFIQKTVELEMVSTSKNIISQAVSSTHDNSAGISDFRFNTNKSNFSQKSPTGANKNTIPFNVHESSLGTPSSILSQTVPGFLLFSSHIRRILTHKCSTSPHFVRICLSIAYLLCTKGYSLWYVWEKLLKATDTDDLINNALDLLEVGFFILNENPNVGIDINVKKEVSRTDVLKPALANSLKLEVEMPITGRKDEKDNNINISSNASDNTSKSIGIKVGVVNNRYMDPKDLMKIQKDGGIESLLELYPWHPNVRQYLHNMTNGTFGVSSGTPYNTRLNDSLEDESVVENKIGARRSSGGIDGIQTEKDKNNKDANNGRYIQKKWLNGISNFDTKFRDARKKAASCIRDILMRSSHIMNVEDEDIMDHEETHDSSLSARKMSQRKSSLLLPSQSDITDKRKKSTDSLGSISDANTNTNSIRAYSQSNLLSGMVINTKDGIAAVEKSNNENHDALDKKPAPQLQKSGFKKLTTSSKQGQSISDFKSLRASETNTKKVESSLSFLTDTYLADLYKSKDVEDLEQDNNEESKNDNINNDAFAALTLGSETNKAKRQSFYNTAQLNNNNNKPIEEKDYPLYSILPEYLTGGKTVTGLGTILGAALSFLYTARSGLKESELWQLLAALQVEEQSNDNELNDDLTSRPNTATLTSAADIAMAKEKDAKANLKKANVNSSSATSTNATNKNRIKVIEKTNNTTKTPLKTTTTDSTNRKSSTASTNSTKPIASDKTNSRKAEPLGPIKEAILLQALTALGVIHLQEHQFLVLSPSDDCLRSVVFDRYIEPSGGKHVWTDRLIKFFQNGPASMRRCEELPWHLKNNRKWWALKNFAVNLDTLTLMFFSDLRNEYLSYWEILINGPMFVTDDTEKEYIDSLFDSDPLSNDSLSTEIRKIEDAVLYATNSNDMDVKKLSLKNQITPFDIIQEMNKSVERWKLKDHPKDSQLQLIIHLIGNFLCEFTLRCYDRPIKPAQNSKKDLKDKDSGNSGTTLTTINNDFSAVAPQYLRQLIDMKYFNTLGIQLEERNATDLNSIKSKNKRFMKLKSVAELSFFEKDAKGAASNDKSFPNKNQVLGNLYLYLRWVWLQFPWLAIENAQIIGEKRLNLLHDQYVEVAKTVLLKNDDDSSLSGGGMLAIHKSSVTGGVKEEASIGSFTSLSVITKDTNKFDIDDLLFDSNNQTNVQSHFASSAAGIKKSLVNTLTNTMATKGATSDNPYMDAVEDKVAKEKQKKEHTEQIEAMNMKDLYNMTKELYSTTAKNTGDIIMNASSKSFTQKKYDPTTTIGTMPLIRESHRTHAVIASSLKSTEKTLGIIDTGTRNLALEENKGIDIKNARHYGLSELNEDNFNNLQDKNTHVTINTTSNQTFIHNGNGAISGTMTTSANTKTSSNNKLALIPFSQNSLKTLKNKSLFVTTEKQRADKILNMETEDVEYYAKANAIVRLGGQPALDPGLWMELQAIAEEQATSYYDQVHGNVIPNSRTDVLNTKEVERIAKLRSLKDRATYFCKQRQHHLSKVKEKYEFREKDDESNIVLSIQGMVKLQDLQLRYIQVQNEILRATQIKTGFEILVETMNFNYPGDPYYLNEIQGYVDLAKAQLLDLVKCRRKTYDEAEKLKVSKTKAYSEKLEYYIDARKQLYNKRKAFLQKYNLQDEVNNLASNANQSKKKKVHHDDSDSDDESKTTFNTESMSAFKDALSKSLERVKKNNELQTVSFKKENRDSRENASWEADYDLITPKDISILQESSNSKYFDNGQLIQEAALSMTATSHVNSRFSKDRDALSKLTDPNNKEYKDLSMKLTLEHILEKTASRTYDDLIERYQSSKLLSESLLSSQQAADERVSRLREEYEELHGSMGSFGLSLLESGMTMDTNGEYALPANKPDNDDISPRGGNIDEDNMSAREPGSLNKTSSNLVNKLALANVAVANNDDQNRPGTATKENDDQFVAEQILVEQERKLHQIESAMDKNQLLLNEAKQGIRHIANIVIVNSKLLGTLPKTAVPSLEKDSDIPICLTWIEEKLVAITEAMALDDSNQLSQAMTSAHDAQRVKTFPERQRDLALSVQNMLSLGKPKIDPVTKQEIRPKKVSIYARPTDEAESSFISASKNVLITPAEDLDDEFNDEMKRLTYKNDKQALAEEIARESELALQKPKNVHKFLDDALASNETRKTLIQAKKFSRQLRGNHRITGGGGGGYGFAIETILASNKLDPNPIRKPYRSDVKVSDDGTVIKPTLKGIQGSESDKRLMSASGSRKSLNSADGGMIRVDHRRMGATTGTVKASSSTPNMSSSAGGRLISGTKAVVGGKKSVNPGTVKKGKVGTKTRLIESDDDNSMNGDNEDRTGTADSRISN